MKNITFVIQKLGVGGVQKNVDFLATKLFNDGYNINVISLSPSVKNTDFNTKGLNLTINSKGLKRFKLFRFIQKIQFLRTTLKNDDSELFITFNVYDAIITLLSKRRRDVPLLCSERTAPSKVSRKIKFLSKVVYNSSSGVVFQTEDAKNYFSHKISKKGIIIHNPYIPKKSLEQSDHIAFENRKNIVVSAVARFEHRKGIDILLKGFALFLEKHHDYKLLIFGDYYKSKRYKDLARKLKIENKVFFMGYRSNVSWEMRDSKIFVLPSRVEGIPNILLEFLAQGVPTVSSDCPSGGTKLLTNNSDRGLLFRNEDYIDLAKKMVYLVENPVFSEKLSIKAIEVKDVYNEKDIYNKWKNYIDKIIDRAKNEKSNK
ncbi:glycosyltransferase [Liberiplasma polymorphum]|uniref:glycosyltransferase n=1 Tax=Liberiplasma polymorphum TaxID=3374570 RepID=UPI0037752116